MTLLDQIRQTIGRYQMLHPGDHLGLAVSGGADSLCLLYALLELRSELGLTLSVIHVDHQLRGARSQADAQFVHNSAQQLGLPFHLQTLDLAPRRGNLEQEARHGRYQFFHHLVREGVVDKVALGHTRSDQAETVLFRLLRGAGSAGLAGIRPVTDSGIVRPLLQVTRSDIEEWLKERQIAWREDETNAELRFDRNRIRHQLIPRLEAEWNPGLSETLAQTADWAYEEERYWGEEIARLIAGAGNWVRFAKNAAVADVNRLNALPVAVARRMIRAIVLEVKGDLLGVSFAHIEAVRRLAGLPEGAGRVQIAGLEVVRSFNWVRFAKPAGTGGPTASGGGPSGTGRSAAGFSDAGLSGAGSSDAASSGAGSSGAASSDAGSSGAASLGAASSDAASSDAGSSGAASLGAGSSGAGSSGAESSGAPILPGGVRLELVCNNGVYNMDVNALDWDKVGEKAANSLVVRSWRPGDCYQRQRHNGLEKIKTLFQKYRIPVWERQDWPVITIGDGIAWAGLFGPAAKYAVGPESRTVLRIHWDSPGVGIAGGLDEA